MPYIDRTSPQPFYHQLYEQLASSIDNGVYAPGKRLPSIRQCARELDVSNTTVELAYQRLTEQGYIESRRGSGFFICESRDNKQGEPHLLSDTVSADLNRLLKLSKNKDADPVEFDFSYDSIDPTLFPTTIWARICREVFFTPGSEQACLYNNNQGLYELRQHIAQYMGSEHDMVVSPEQVIVMPTTRTLLRSIANAMDPHIRVGMEEPGYNEVARAFSHLTSDVIRIPTWHILPWEEIEARIDGCGVLFLTPSNQFPTNHVMNLDMRKKILAWARDNGAYIIDDEYGSEFQTGPSRLPSFGSLDTSGNVITMGTFSNSFTPAVCLSFAILPPKLMLRWLECEGSSHPQVPWQTQAAMASFIEHGHWRSHIRKVRTAMLKKRSLLLDALKSYFGDNLDIISESGSLYTLVQTHDGRGEDELIRAAARKGVRVYPTSMYWSGPVPEGWRYVLVGYSGIGSANIEPGISQLAEAWGF